MLKVIHMWKALFTWI